MYKNTRKWQYKRFKCGNIIFHKNYCSINSFKSLRLTDNYHFPPEIMRMMQQGDSFAICNQFF